MMVIAGSADIPLMLIFDKKVAAWSLPLASGVPHEKGAGNLIYTHENG